MSDTPVNREPPDDAENQLTDSLAVKINAVIVQHFKDHGEDGARTRPVGIACATIIGSYFAQIEPVENCEKALGEFIMAVGESIAFSRHKDGRTMGGSFARPDKKDA